MTCRYLIAAITILIAPFDAQAGIGRAFVRGAARVTSRSISRGAAKSAGHAVMPSAKDLFRRDIHRGPVRPLVQPRTVFRYTTKEWAISEAKRGVAPGRHMTSQATPGRPLSADHAQRAFGLPQKPRARETIRLNQGFPVRHGRVVGGAPGKGEITSPRRVSPTKITKVVPLR